MLVRMQSIAFFFFFPAQVCCDEVGGIIPILKLDANSSPVIFTAPLDCEELIITGDVTIQSSAEKISNLRIFKPPLRSCLSKEHLTDAVEIDCGIVRFEPGSSIRSWSDMFIEADNVVGDIRIVGARKRYGGPAAPGQIGMDGESNVCLILEALDFAKDATLEILLRGGDGGRGGDGLNGNLGGRGGGGGQGGSIRIGVGESPLPSDAVLNTRGGAPGVGGLPAGWLGDLSLDGSIEIGP